MNAVTFFDHDPVSCEPALIAITLKDGESEEFTSGGSTEEGYGYTGKTYRREGNSIFVSTRSWGRDCDGGYEHNREFECNISQLASRPAICSTEWVKNADGEEVFTENYFTDATGKPVMIPTWESIGASQRDEYAELAGY